MVAAISPFSSNYFVDPIRRSGPFASSGIDVEKPVYFGLKGFSYEDTISSMAKMARPVFKVADTDHLPAWEIEEMLQQIERGRQEAVTPFV